MGEILTALGLPSRVQTVGVFVNRPIEEVKTVLDQTGLTLAQLHGDESVGDLAALKGRGFKAVRPVDSAAAQEAFVFTSYPQLHAPQLLLDAYHPSAYGGTGHQADWAMASVIARSVSRLLLAGGLNPDNVQTAIDSVRPWGVDVASGVEASPGRKDHALIRAFVANAKAAP